MKTSKTTQPTYIIGLSGGPDSVFLVHQMVQTYPDYTFIGAHLDHEWRKESDKDAFFCKELCKKVNIAFETAKASELSFTVKYNGSQEEVGRKLRRHYFESLVHKYKADGIILGHHADDQLETFFIRLVRGTTPQGLACMKQEDGLYLRPLLDINKTTILEWLKENKCAYLEDVTNYSDKYLRNRIRNHVVPAFKAVDQRAEANFARSLKQMQQTEEFLQELTVATLSSLLKDKQLDIAGLLVMHPYMQKRLLQVWLAQEQVTHTLTDAFLEEILKFLKSPRGGTHQLGSHWSIVKKQNKASINQNQNVAFLGNCL